MTRSKALKVRSKWDVWFFVLCGGVGLLLLIATLVLGVCLCLNAMRKDLKRHIGELKSQCNDYDDFLATDEVKSLFQLSTQAETIALALPLLSEEDRKEFLQQQVDILRLDCVLLLDQELAILESFCKSAPDQALWERFAHRPPLVSVRENPRKCYSERIVLDGSDYDLASAALADAKGIVVCARKKNASQVRQYYAPVRHLLASNETNLGGTMYVTLEDEIISSNKDLGYHAAHEVPEIAALQAHKQQDFTHFIIDGVGYFGDAKKCRAITSMSGIQAAMSFSLASAWC